MIHKQNNMPNGNRGALLPVMRKKNTNSPINVPTNLRRLRRTTCASWYISIFMQQTLCYISFSRLSEYCWDGRGCWSAIPATIWEGAVPCLQTGLHKGRVHREEPGKVHQRSDLLPAARVETEEPNQHKAITGTTDYELWTLHWSTAIGSDLYVLVCYSHFLLSERVTVLYVCYIIIVYYHWEHTFAPPKLLWCT